MPYVHSKYHKEPIWIPDPPKAKGGRRPVPVVEIDIKDPRKMWDYEYQAKSCIGKDVILASNSLENLKKEIKRRRWVVATLSMTNGMFSAGQTAVYEYPYHPQYK
jgi:hypothetical protein